MAGVISKLAKYGACDIADALTKLKYPAGGFLSGLELRASTDHSTKMVGRAHTVLFRRNSIAAPIKRFQGHYIDTVTPGSVLFISAPENMPNAVYGGLMAKRAQVLGAVGAVVDGRIRDLAEHRDIKLPTFSRGVGITAGQELCYSSEINVPVRLHSTGQAEVWVKPGDIIVGDENGIACIPQELEQQVVDIIESLAERDRLSMEDIAGGRSADETFRARRV